MGKSGSVSKKKKNTESFEINKTEINERQKDLISSMIVEKVNLSAKNDSQ